MKKELAILKASKIYEDDDINWTIHSDIRYKNKTAADCKGKLTASELTELESDRSTNYLDFKAKHYIAIMGCEFTNAFILTEPTATNMKNNCVFTFFYVDDGAAFLRNETQQTADDHPCDCRYRDAWHYYQPRHSANLLSHSGY